MLEQRTKEDKYLDEGEEAECLAICNPSSGKQKGLDEMKAQQFVASFCDARGYGRGKTDKARQAAAAASGSGSNKLLLGGVVAALLAAVAFFALRAQNSAPPPPTGHRCTGIPSRDSDVSCTAQPGSCGAAAGTAEAAARRGSPKRP